jgi:chromosome segregation ATPase
VSDRAAKTAFEDIDDARILAKVAALPVSEWSYSAQGTGIRHLGPMAQDFRAAFGLGEDDKHITTIDEEGVALAAIKALQAEVSAKDGELEDNKRHLRDNERQLDGNVRELSGLALKYTRLEQRLEALEQNGQTNASAQPGFKGR